MNKSYVICSALFCAAVLSCGLGCGRKEVDRYPVAGKVTFQGQPVAKGRIQFLPNPAKGNKGPAGYADIQDGTYETEQGGQGGPGGEVIVRVEGYQETPDHKTGRPLFLNYQKEVDQPRANAVLDIDVPVTAGVVHYNEAEVAP